MNLFLFKHQIFSSFLNININLLFKYNIYNFLFIFQNLEYNYEIYNNIPLNY